jgi:hypothetical protein
MTTIFMGLTSVVDDGRPQMRLNEPPRMSLSDPKSTRLPILL